VFRQVEDELFNRELSEEEREGGGNWERKDSGGGVRGE